jgi:hypothetical protein
VEDRIRVGLVQPVAIHAVLTVSSSTVNREGGDLWRMRPVGRALSSGEGQK